MKFRDLHPWDIGVKEATRIQDRLSPMVEKEGNLGEVRLIGAVDVAYSSKFKKKCYAKVIVFSFPELREIERKEAVESVTFLYIPTFLSFREIPVILEAIKKIDSLPGVFLIDGQGIAHPRGLGLASHLGILLDTPTIGCAKEILVGTYEEKKLGEIKGSYLPILYQGRVIGTAVRTKDKTKPVFVSIGHKISLEKATEIILATSRGYRIPQPLRIAHIEAESLKRSEDKYE